MAEDEAENVDAATARDNLSKNAIVMKKPLLEPDSSASVMEIEMGLPTPSLACVDLARERDRYRRGRE